ncbi:unnamed protein product [Ectocarpus sp. CCAP 1310/34]|nr:unnamed protein product [Ectocarpus sp. CCAP 1310/34]
MDITERWRMMCRRCDIGVRGGTLLVPHIPHRGQNNPTLSAVGDNQHVARVGQGVDLQTI